ncbi:MAG: hypothetical protein RLZZ324_1325, partial [Candidatus Parcubacteria bacterium]
MTPKDFSVMLATSEAAVATFQTR